MQAGVAQALGLGDGVTAGGHGVERRGEAREVEAQLALHAGGVAGGFDDGANQRGVWKAGVVGAGALLGVRDQANALAVRRWPCPVGGVKRVRGGLAAKPRTAVEDTHQPTLRAACSDFVGGTVEEVRELGEARAGGWVTDISYAPVRAHNTVAA